MTDIYRLSTLEYDKISFKSPIKRGNYYYSAITYDSDKPLYLETPNIFCDEDLLKCKDTISVKLSSEDFSVYDKLLELDEHNVKNTTHNSENWFKKQLPEDVVRNMYKRITNPIVKDELPKIELRIPKLKEKIQCGVFDKDGIPLAKEEIKRDTEIKCILHVRGLKFLKKYFYCDVYITQIKIADHRVYNIPNECLFNKDDQDYRLTLPEDVIDAEMIKEIEDEIVKKEQLQIKRDEMNEIKNEIKILETKLKSIREEYDEIDID
jgi:hypothetical protein